MPTFEGVEATVTVDVDFEVFCGTCGEGLCLQSDTRSSRSRGYPQVTVEACQCCIGREIETARQEGYDEGYSDGEAFGFKAGQECGE